MSRIAPVTLALLLLAAGAVYYSYSRDIAEARLLVAGGTKTVETSFGRVEYAERGQGEAVLSIHGSGGGFDQGLLLAASLPENHRVIAPSRFGYLGSTYPKDPTIAMQADAFAELLDQLAVDKAIVMGGSAGALSATEFAIRYPERCRALILLVPAAYSPDRKPNTSAAEGPFMEAVVRAMLGSDFIFWSWKRLFPDSMVKMILATDPALVHAADPSEQARVRTILDHILPVSARALGLVFDTRTAGEPTPQEVARISCPVLSISSRDDMYGTAGPAEYIAAHVTNGKAVIFPLGGHVFVGHDTDVRREIRSFLESIDRNTRAPASS